MMHFPPCFRFFPIFEKFSESVENFPSFTFSRKICPFSSAKISDDLFFSHRPQISNFPLCFGTFPPVSQKLLFPPYFQNFPLCFRKIHLLFTCFLCISFPPYFYHNAFLHHPMHVLDAPERPA